MHGKPTLGEMSNSAFFEDLHEADFPALFEALRREYGTERAEDDGSDATSA